jgi:hypothetical protein
MEAKTVGQEDIYKITPALACNATENEFLPARF